MSIFLPLLRVSLEQFYPLLWNEKTLKLSWQGNGDKALSLVLPLQDPQPPAGTPAGSDKCHFRRGLESGQADSIFPKPLNLKIYVRRYQHWQRKKAGRMRWEHGWSLFPSICMFLFCKCCNWICISFLPSDQKAIGIIFLKIEPKPTSCPPHVQTLRSGMKETFSVSQFIFTDKGGERGGIFSVTRKLQRN